VRTHPEEASVRHSTRAAAALKQETRSRSSSTVRRGPDGEQADPGALPRHACLARKIWSRSSD